MKRLATKVFASTIALVSFTTNCLLASAPESNYWAERRKQSKLAKEASSDASLAAILQASSGSAHVLKGLPAIGSHHLGQLTPALAEALEKEASPGALRDISSTVKALPYQYGTVRKILTPAKASQKIVIHIQDVHQNEEAQRNISGAVRELLIQEKAQLIGLEGSWEDMGALAAPYRETLKGDALKHTADYLLRTHEISGPMHTAMTAEGKLPAFLGIDHPEHYRANVQAYRDSVEGMKADKQRLALLRQDIDRRKAEAFNPDLRRFDDHVESYRRSAVSLGAYLDHPHFKGAAPAQVRAFLSALSMEKSLDFAVVEKERSALIEALVKKLTQAQLQSLLDHSVAYRVGNVSHTAYYERIQGLCRMSGLSLKQYPAMDDYIRYVLVTDRIDAAKLLSEVQSLEAETYRALAKTDAEKALVNRSKQAHLAGKLLDFALAPDEWSEYASANGSLAPGLDLSRYEAFYREAKARDLAMTASLKAAMEKEKAKVAVLVAGGFHAQGMGELLRKEGITVIQFVPRLTKVDTAQGSSYLSAFTQEKTPLEKLFDGDRLFVAKHPGLRPGGNAPVVAGMEAIAHGDQGAAEELLKKTAPGSRLAVERSDKGNVQVAVLKEGAEGKVNVTGRHDNDKGFITLEMAAAVSLGALLVGGAAAGIAHMLASASFGVMVPGIMATVGGIFAFNRVATVVVLAAIAIMGFTILRKTNGQRFAVMTVLALKLIGCDTSGTAEVSRPADAGAETSPVIGGTRGRGTLVPMTLPPMTETPMEKPMGTPAGPDGGVDAQPGIQTDAAPDTAGARPDGGMSMAADAGSVSASPIPAVLPPMPNDSFGVNGVYFHRGFAPTKGTSREIGAVRGSERGPQPEQAADFEGELLGEFAPYQARDGKLYLYVPAWNQGLLVLDVTNMDDPSSFMKQAVAIPTGDTAHGVRIFGDVMAVFSTRLVPPTYAYRNVLKFYRLTNATAPVYIGETSPFGAGFLGYARRRSMVPLDENRLLFNDPSQGVFLIDLRRPSDVQPFIDEKKNADEGDLLLDAPRRVLYRTTEAGLDVWDISGEKPALLQSVPSIRLGMDIVRKSVSGKDYLFVGGKYNGKHALTVLEQDAQGRLTMKGNLDVPIFGSFFVFEKMTFEGNDLVSSGPVDTYGNIFQVRVDVSRPESPKLISKTEVVFGTYKKEAVDGGVSDARRPDGGFVGLLVLGSMALGGAAGALTLTKLIAGALSVTAGTALGLAVIAGLAASGAAYALVLFFGNIAIRLFKARLPGLVLTGLLAIGCDTESMGKANQPDAGIDAMGITCSIDQGALEPLSGRTGNHLFPRFEALQRPDLILIDRIDRTRRSKSLNKGTVVHVEGVLGRENALVVLEEGRLAIVDASDVQAPKVSGEMTWDKAVVDGVSYDISAANMHRDGERIYVTFKYRLQDNLTRSLAAAFLHVYEMDAAGGLREVIRQRLAPEANSQVSSSRLPITGWKDRLAVDAGPWGIRILNKADLSPVTALLRPEELSALEAAEGRLYMTEGLSLDPKSLSPVLTVYNVEDFSRPEGRVTLGKGVLSVRKIVPMKHTDKNGHPRVIAFLPGAFGMGMVELSPDGMDFSSPMALPTYAISAPTSPPYYGSSVLDVDHAGGHALSVLYEEGYNGSASAEYGPHIYHTMILNGCDTGRLTMVPGSQRDLPVGRPLVQDRDRGVYTVHLAQFGWETIKDIFISDMARDKRVARIQFGRRDAPSFSPKEDAVRFHQDGAYIEIPFTYTPSRGANGTVDGVMITNRHGRILSVARELQPVAPANVPVPFKIVGVTVNADGSADIRLRTFVSFAGTELNPETTVHVPPMANSWAPESSWWNLPPIGAPMPAEPRRPDGGSVSLMILGFMTLGGIIGALTLTKLIAAALSVTAGTALGLSVMAGLAASGAAYALVLFFGNIAIRLFKARLPGLVLTGLLAIGCDTSGMGQVFAPADAGADTLPRQDHEPLTPPVLGPRPVAPVPMAMLPDAGAPDTLAPADGGAPGVDAGGVDGMGVNPLMCAVDEKAVKAEQPANTFFDGAKGPFQVLPLKYGAGAYAVVDGTDRTLRSGNIAKTGLMEAQSLGGDTLLLMEKGRLAVVDVSDRRNPVLLAPGSEIFWNKPTTLMAGGVSRTYTPRAAAWVVDGDKVYALFDYERFEKQPNSGLTKDFVVRYLHVFDISNRQVLREVGKYPLTAEQPANIVGWLLDSYPRAMAGWGNNLVVDGGPAGSLQILSKTNPGTVVRTLPRPEGLTALTVTGDHLALASTVYGKYNTTLRLHNLSASDPSAIVKEIPIGAEIRYISRIVPVRYGDRVVAFLPAYYGLGVAVLSEDGRDFSSPRVLPSRVMTDPANYAYFSFVASLDVRAHRLFMVYNGGSRTGSFSDGPDFQSVTLDACDPAALKEVPGTKRDMPRDNLLALNGDRGVYVRNRWRSGRPDYPGATSSIADTPANDITIWNTVEEKHVGQLGIGSESSLRGAPTIFVPKEDGIRFEQNGKFIVIPFTYKAYWSARDAAVRLLDGFLLTDRDGAVIARLWNVQKAGETQDQARGGRVTGMTVNADGSTDVRFERVKADYSGYEAEAAFRLDPSPVSKNETWWELPPVAPFALVLGAGAGLASLFSIGAAQAAVNAVQSSAGFLAGLLPQADTLSLLLGFGLLAAVSVSRHNRGKGPFRWIAGGAVLVAAVVVALYGMFSDRPTVSPSEPAREERPVSPAASTVSEFMGALADKLSRSVHPSEKALADIVRRMTAKVQVSEQPGLIAQLEPPTRPNVSELPDYRLDETGFPGFHFRVGPVFTELLRLNHRHPEWRSRLEPMMESFVVQQAGLLQHINNHRDQNGQPYLDRVQNQLLRALQEHWAPYVKRGTPQAGTVLIKPEWLRQDPILASLVQTFVGVNARRQAEADLGMIDYWNRHHGRVSLGEILKIAESQEISDIAADMLYGFTLEIGADAQISALGRDRVWQTAMRGVYKNLISPTPYASGPKVAYLLAHAVEIAEGRAGNRDRNNWIPAEQVFETAGKTFLPPASYMPYVRLPDSGDVTPEDLEQMFGPAPGMPDTPVEKGKPRVPAIGPISFALIAGLSSFLALGTAKADTLTAVSQTTSSWMLLPAMALLLLGLTSRSVRESEWFKTLQSRWHAPRDPFIKEMGGIRIYRKDPVPALRTRQWKYLRENMKNIPALRYQSYGSNSGGYYGGNLQLEFVDDLKGPGFQFRLEAESYGSKAIIHTTPNADPVLALLLFMNDERTTLEMLGYEQGTQAVYRHIWKLREMEKESLEKETIEDWDWIRVSRFFSSPKFKAGDYQESLGTPLIRVEKAFSIPTNEMVLRKDGTLRGFSVKGGWDGELGRSVWNVKYLERADNQSASPLELLDYLGREERAKYKDGLVTEAKRRLDLVLNAMESPLEALEREGWGPATTGPEGRYLILAKPGHGVSMKLYSLDRQRVVELPGLNKPYAIRGISSKNQLVVAQTIDDGISSVFDISRSDHVRPLEQINSFLAGRPDSDVDFSPRGKYILVEDRGTAVFDASGGFVKAFPGSEGRRVTFSGNDLLALVSFEDARNSYLVEMATGKKFSALNDANKLLLTPHGSRVLFYQEKGPFYLYLFETETILRRMDRADTMKRSADGRFVMFAVEDPRRMSSEAVIWDTVENREIDLGGLKGRVSDVRFDKKGQWMELKIHGKSKPRRFSLLTGKPLSVRKKDAGMAGPGFMVGLIGVTAAAALTVLAVNAGVEVKYIVLAGLGITALTAAILWVRSKIILMGQALMGIMSMTVGAPINRFKTPEQRKAEALKLARVLVALAALMPDQATAAGIAEIVQGREMSLGVGQNPVVSLVNAGLSDVSEEDLKQAVAVVKGETDVRVTEGQALWGLSAAAAQYGSQSVQAAQSTALTQRNVAVVIVTKDTLGSVGLHLAAAREAEKKAVLVVTDSALLAEVRALASAEAAGAAAAIVEAPEVVARREGWGPTLAAQALELALQGDGAARKILQEGGNSISLAIPVGMSVDWTGVSADSFLKQALIVLNSLVIQRQDFDNLMRMAALIAQQA